MRSFLILAVSVATACASSQRASQQQSRSLFDGRDLSGWHVDVPADSNVRVRNPFIVRKGMLVSLGEPRGHLITNATYRDYRLEVEYRFPAAPGNAGVLVHASTPRALYGMFPRSIEVQMEHGNAGDFWCILEDIRVPDMERRRGPPAEWGTTEGKARRILNLTDSSEKPLGQWNTMVIEAVGRSIKVWVNGDMVNEGSDATADHGQIALQSEGSEVEFRKLWLTPMSAQKVTDSQAPQSTPFRLESVQWSEPYNGPLGYPKGAQRASVGVDPRSGGETYYARFPAGSRFALHWHAYAEYAVVLRGKVTHTLGKNSYALVPGDYVVIPPRVNHAWAADKSGDVVLLIRRDGPSDFNFVTP